MLIAEDLLLLLTDDETGKPVVDTSKLDLALAGAVLVDLAELDRVDVAGPGEPVKEGRLYVRDTTPTGEPVLDETLSRIGARGPRSPPPCCPTSPRGCATHSTTASSIAGSCGPRRGGSSASSRAISGPPQTPRTRTR